MVIPVYDVNPVRRTPWVTYALVAINVAVLLLTPVALGTLMGSHGPAAECRQAAFYSHYAAIPRELVNDRPLRLVPSGRASIALIPVPPRSTASSTSSEEPGATAAVTGPG